MEVWEFIKNIQLNQSSVIFAVAGAIGAFVRDLIDNDGVIVLPRKTNGSISLGFIYLCFIGAFVGFIVDSSFVKSLLAGFLCMSLARGLGAYFEKQRKAKTGDKND